MRGLTPGFGVPDPGRRFETPKPGVSLRTPGLVRLPLTLLLLASLACRTPPPNVVLVTVDTLRADRLGCYGSQTTKTPHVDRLAAEGLVFDRAFAPLPETRPAHYTIFTSLYPSDHGVVSNLWPAADGLTTLGGLYAEAGWATAGFAGCQLFDADAGRALGFGHFDVPDEPQRTADAVVGAAVRWLDERPRERPFFLWLHLFDPHMPYVPPPPWNESSAPRDVEEWPSFSWPRLLESARRHGGDLPRRVFERALDLYGAEVEYTDHQLGLFFDALRKRGLYDDALIVLVADHGECFENGVFFDHSQCLGEGALRVPLVLRYPGVAPGRSETPVELLDVAPTLARLSGLAVPAAFRGRGLLERRPEEAPDVFFQQPLYRTLDVANRQVVLDELRAVAGEPTRPIAGDRLPFGVRRGPWKYVRDGDRERLYNLAEDGAERRDLTDREPELLRDLRHAAWEWLREHPIAVRDTSELDAELVERLEALGYL